MPAGARERDEVGDRRRRLDHLRLRRPAAAHRDDDDVAVAREQPREVPGDRRLADALAGADHGDRRQLERLEQRRVEAEVGADVRQARRERARDPAEPLGRPEHRLVGEVDDDLGAVEARRRAARRSRRRRAASRCRRPGSRRPTRTAAPRARRARRARSAPRRSERRRAHRFAVTSRSIRPVYFSYSPVARSNWMIRSWPWNG